MNKAKTRFTAEERKIQILKCAVRIFARSNYRGARISDIADEIGISEAAIYKYFPSKKCIFLEILKHMSERIIMMWQEEFEKEPDALKALRAMGMKYYRRMIEHPHQLKVHFQAISEIADEDVAEQLRLAHKSYVQFISNVLKKGIQQGKIRKDVDVYAIAWLFDGLGITMNMIEFLSFNRRSHAKVITQIADHLMKSIEA